jgi:quinol monooxygenase YgiN
MNTAITDEQGVLNYHVVNEKENPSNFTLINEKRIQS